MLRIAYETFKDNVLHHVLGLESGEYLTRDILPPDQAMELAYAEMCYPSDEPNLYAVMPIYQTKRIVDALPEAE